MKNLTKYVVLLVLCFISFHGKGQSTIRLKAGLNLAKMMEKDKEETFSDDYKVNPGFHAGFGADIPLSASLSIEPGLLMETKGVKIEETMGSTEVVGKANLFYMDVPIMLKATSDLGDGSKIYAAFGPYFGIATFGNFTTIDGDKKEHETVEWGEDGVLKRLDYGLGFGVGFEIKNFLLGFSYDLGLANILSNTDNGAKSKHRVFKLSIGAIVDE